eukprot:8974026-Pyramimonas_sp.AAC.1
MGAALAALAAAHIPNRRSPARRLLRGNAPTLGLAPQLSPSPCGCCPQCGRGEAAVSTRGP